MRRREYRKPLNADILWFLWRHMPPGRKSSFSQEKFTIRPIQSATLTAFLAHFWWSSHPLSRILRRLSFYSYRLASLLTWPIFGVRSPLRGFERSTPTYAKRKGFPCKLFDDGAFVASIPRGRVLWNYGVSVTPEHRLLSDVSVQFSYSTISHSALHRARFPRIKKIDGRLALLSSYHHHIYFHWMFDVLPRLGLIREANIDVDQYIVN